MDDTAQTHYAHIVAYYRFKHRLALKYRDHSLLHDHNVMADRYLWWNNPRRT